MSDSITDAVVTSYLETLLWTSTLSVEDGGSVTIEGDEYDDGTSLDSVPGCDVSDLDTLAPKVVKEAREDLEGFLAHCLETIGLDPFRFFDAGHVAHDFCLSRNGHGAGFFDGSYVVTVDGKATELRDELQDAAETFGTFGLMVWVDEAGALRMESHS